MKADALRSAFLEFFKSKKHRIVESDSLVPKNDPTVLFTPAGMNQFKEQFLGHLSGFTRAATSQRCLRTDDLDKVGKTSGHHTFFEMLGNFSFGDYFKEEAVSWAWEFLTQKLSIPAQRLWVSVYQDDEEAYAIWRDRIKVPPEKICRLGDKDNFWPSEAKQKGPNGPCGPCSEIFYDFGENTGCGKAGCNPACSCGRFVEVWNLVFTQFNRKEGGVLEPLPRKNIDTGMGLERLAAVMQGKATNFETDLFVPLLDEIRAAAKTAAENRLAYAIADHCRAISFSIFDGILPSNEGRGYVVRKLIRKAVMDAASLGIQKPFLHTLVAILASVMRQPYPLFYERKEDIAQVILAEEKGYLKVLSSSDELLAEAFSFPAKAGTAKAGTAKAGTVQKPGAEETGRMAFHLYDTRGIPLELTRQWLQHHGLSFSQKAYDEAMQEQKNRSKAQSAMKGDVFASAEIKLKIAATKFVGYRCLESKSRICGILRAGEPVSRAAAGSEVEIVLDKTPFYAESGGQVGDSGTIVKGRSVFEVSATRKQGRFILHRGKMAKGSMRTGEAVSALVDGTRRLSVARNHTATHLLQSALRRVLGPHVKQQGSLVEAERLRFDFSHFKALTDEELRRVEELVNEAVLSATDLAVKEMTLQKAQKSGALAFFAEKYEGSVRVVSIGEVSRELCGGTHLDNTSLVGIFKIVREGSVASGVRRIEAVSGAAAYRLIQADQQVVSELAGMLNTSASRLVPEVEKRLGRIKDLEKQLLQQKSSAVRGSAEAFLQDAQKVGGVCLVTREVEGADMNALRSAADLLRQKASGSVIALGSREGERAFLVVAVTPDLCSRGFDASALVREIAAVIGGSGGGRTDFAQAGGSQPQRLAEAFGLLKEIVGKRQ